MVYLLHILLDFGLCKCSVVYILLLLVCLKFVLCCCSMTKGAIRARMRRDNERKEKERKEKEGSVGSEVESASQKKV